ncbi:MAG: M48 family metallopeptidase [Caldisericia bacterium]|nr:M48 family metallopeptidase [Caldisericia bacterium]
MVENKKHRVSIYYSNRQSYSVSFGTDGTIIVRVPLRSTKKSVQSFIDTNAPWIKKNIFKYKDFFYVPYKYQNDEIFHFKGRKYSLIVEYDNNNSVFLHNSNICVKTFNDNPEYIKVLLQKWYRKKAIAFFQEIIPPIQNTFYSLGIIPSDYHYRRMKRKWGSCSTSGVITLNTDLIKAEIPAINYIVIHELCHIKHFNHGEEFKALLSSVYPNWKNVKKTLDVIPGW